MFVEDGISLGHNRLSIIDPQERSDQPMKSASGRYVITYNGELYNFKELRKELESRYAFRTESDTEVVVAAYERWGEDCVRRCNGMFAFALWDTATKELFLARDPMGIKPLYYRWENGRFVFSSEIKGVLAHDMPRQLDSESFAHYLRLQYVPSPYTMFAGVRKLPAGAFARCGAKGLSIKNYETRVTHSRSASGNDLATPLALRETIMEAVKRQLVSDKPLGVYLSGGIDSSVVLKGAAEHSSSVDTFSIGFTLDAKEEPEKFNADFKLARATARCMGARHHEVLVSSRDVLSVLEMAVYALDEPIANPTATVQFLLSRFAKGQGVDVVLSGDGGDELFGGYERYRLSLLASYYQRVLPWGARAALSAMNDRFAKLNTPTGVDRFMLFSAQKDPTLREVVLASFVSGATRDYFEEHFFRSYASSFEEQFMRADRSTWLVDEALARGDKMSMAHGLEQRVPLLDVAVVAHAEGLPLSEKVTLRDTKVLFKAAFRDDLPDALFRQPKRGWFSPAAKWLRHEEMQSFAREVLSPSYYAETKELFAWSGVEAMLKQHITGERYNLTMLWTLLTFQIWARAYGVKCSI